MMGTEICESGQRTVIYGQVNQSVGFERFAQVTL